MTPTSDERREVAERLRQMADAHDATEASRVARALGLEYKVYGTVVAFDSADIRNLADLIDPTCHVSDEEVTHQPTLDAMAVHVYTCDRCNSPFYMGDVCMHPKPLYCPYCGARVVRDDD